MSLHDTKIIFNLWTTMQKLHNLSAVVPVYDLVEANGTYYAIIEKQNLFRFVSICSATRKAIFLGILQDLCLCLFSQQSRHFIQTVLFTAQSRIILFFAETARCILLRFNHRGKRQGDRFGIHRKRRLHST